MAAHGADGGTGSARRRRERRLRSWLRHEQSIAAVLATVTHHSFDKVGTASGVLRNKKTATRTGKGEESEKMYTAKFRKTPPPQAAVTEYFPMTDDEGGELSAGVRPAPLEGERPQGKLERHAGIGYEIVQNFDVPATGVVAGTVPRRWNGKGGGRRWGPGVQSSSVAVSLQKVSGVYPGETDSGGFLLVSSVAGGAETEPGGAQIEYSAAETDVGGAQIEYSVVETGSGNVQWDALGTAFGRAADHPCSSGGAGAGRHDVLGTAVCCAASRAAGLGRRAKRLQVRFERTEAGSLDSFGNDAFLSCRIESPSSRVARVTSALHNLCPDHSSLIPAHNSHARMPRARSVENSVGDTEDGGRLSCVYGVTKSMSKCTRTGVRCPSVEKLASPQQAPGSLHDEMWAGILQKQGPKIFREMESVPGFFRLKLF